jgi:hypothetical protein
MFDLSSTFFFFLFFFVFFVLLKVAKQSVSKFSQKFFFAETNERHVNV